jgi:hypothetical protein
LGAVTGVEFGEQASDVGFRCGHGDVQGGADLLVGVAKPDQAENLAFPLGEVGDVTDRVVRRGAPQQVGGDQLTCGGRSKERVAGGDGADGGDQVSGAGGLQQEAR